MTDSDKRGFLQALDSAPSPADLRLIAAGAVGSGNFTHGGSINGSGTASGGISWSGANGSSLWPAQTGVNGTTRGGVGPWRNNTNGDQASMNHSNEYYNYGILVLLLVPALTIFGNVLVVLAVRRERSLQSATNYFIVSLAFADILVATLVMPVSVFVEVRSGNWDFSDQLCDIWIMCDALFSTASILNLVAISIDRFIAVTQPIKYAKHKNSKRTHFTIAVTWLLSIGIALPIGCGLQNMQGLRYHEQFRRVCTFFNGDFLIYSSLGSFYIPCIVMLVLYHRIFKVIRSRARKADSAKKLRDRPAQQQQQQQQQLQQQLQQSSGRNDAGKGGNNNCAARRPQTLQAAATTPKQRKAGFGDDPDNGCLACQTDGIYTGEQQPAAHTCRRKASEEGLDSSSSPQQQQQQQQQQQKQLSGSPTLPGPSNSDNSGGAASDGGGSGKAATTPGGSGGSGKKKQQLFQQLKLRKKSTTTVSKAERSAARREKKATKTLAIVLGVFLFCWMPFFITNLMWAACLKNFHDQEHLKLICQYDRRINVFIVWLGYVNSFLNPLIYTIFNMEFRKAFKKLLRID